MKRLILLVFLLSLLIGGLNLSAAGLHRLMPQSPPYVFSLERAGGGLKLHLMDFESPAIPYKLQIFKRNI